MSIKTVWVVSGNKGGVGKSLFCLALASAFEMRGEHYAVLDGDGRTGDVHAAFLRKVPARWGDFRLLRPESHNCPYDAVYEGLLRQLLAGSQHLIVNTPDGADSMLIKWFDLTLSHAEMNNCVFKFIYLMSDRPDGLDMLPDLAERFSFMYPVRNLHFGDPELFVAFEDHASMFHEVLDFDVLRSEEVRALFDLNTYPAEALGLMMQRTRAYAMPTLERARLYRWMASFNEKMDSVIANIEVPNVK